MFNNLVPVSCLCGPDVAKPLAYPQFRAAQISTSWWWIFNLDTPQLASCHRHVVHHLRAHNRAEMSRTWTDQSIFPPLEPPSCHYDPTQSLGICFTFWLQYPKHSLRASRLLIQKKILKPKRLYITSYAQDTRDQKQKIQVSGPKRIALTSYT